MSPVFSSTKGESGIGKGALVGAIVGGIAGATALSAIVSLLILRMRMKRNYQAAVKKRQSEYNPLFSRTSRRN